MVLKPSANTSSAGLPGSRTSSSSGKPRRGGTRWRHGPASFLFIDAVHDYVNTAFDIATWSPLLVPGGILALHDTDQEIFAGTRRAAFETLGHDHFELLAHPSNLTLFVAR